MLRSLDISIGHMASRFKSKLFLVLSHSPQPFDQQAPTASLHFESRVLKNTRQHLFNSSKGWPLNIPFDPSPSGQGAHYFSLCHIWQLAAWALGVGWGSGPLGAATRCPRRRRPFHFFFATWPFLAIRNVRVLGFTTTDGRTKPGSPQTPIPRTENRQNFIAKIFLAILKSEDLYCFSRGLLPVSPFAKSAGQSPPNQEVKGLTKKVKAFDFLSKAPPRKPVTGGDSI